MNTKQIKHGIAVIEKEKMSDGCIAHNVFFRLDVTGELIKFGCVDSVFAEQLKDALLASCWAESVKE